MAICKNRIKELKRKTRYLYLAIRAIHITWFNIFLQKSGGSSGSAVLPSIFNFFLSASEPGKVLIRINEVSKLKNGTAVKPGKFQRNCVFNADLGLHVGFSES